MRVEPGRDEHELGLEARNRGLDRVLERVHVLRVARSCGHRHVQRRLGLVVGAAATGIKRPLMQRDEEHGVVVPEHCLCAVAVMHVEVDDRDAFEPEPTLRRTRRDRDVVEHAEAHGALGQSVMPGRSHEREASVQRGLDRRTGRECRRLPRRLGGDGVVVEPLRSVECAHARDVLVGVAGAKLVLARRPTLGPARKMLQQHAEPLGSLRVVTRRVQARKRRMRQEVDRTIWSSSSSDAAPARARPSR